MNINGALELNLEEFDTGRDRTYSVLGADWPFADMDAFRSTVESFADVTSVGETYSLNTGGNCYWYAFVTYHSGVARCHVLLDTGWCELRYTGEPLQAFIEDACDTASEGDELDTLAAGYF